MGKHTALPDWIRSGSLEDRSHMILINLHPELTVAYDRNLCDLYLAYGDEIREEQGPTPRGRKLFRPVEPIYHEKTAAMGWRRREQGKNIEVPCRNFTLIPEGREVKITYSLKLSKGREVKVEERIFHDNHYGDNGLARNFNLEGLDTAQDTLFLHLGGPVSEESLSISGNGRLEGKGATAVFLTNLNGYTGLKWTWSTALR